MPETTTSSTSQQQPVSPSLNAPLWCLRILIVMQCVGVAAKVLWVEEASRTPSKVFGFLFANKWPEALAISIDRWGMIALLVAALWQFAVPLIPGVQRASRWVALPLVFVASWFFLLGAFSTYLGGHFMSEWTLVEHAVRFAAPLALLILMWQREQMPQNPEALTTSLTGQGIADRMRPLAFWMLRLAVAATFFGHGLVAFRHGPHFIDLVLNTLDNAGQAFPWLQWLADWSTEDGTKLALTIIGLLDFLVAALILCARWRMVALYMVIWGALTALSRMTAMGWARYPEPLIRAGNYGVPLALFLYWNYCRRNCKQAPPPST